jgi:hypothetical protein
MTLEQSRHRPQPGHVLDENQWRCDDDGRRRRRRKTDVESVPDVSFLTCITRRVNVLCSHPLPHHHPQFLYFTQKIKFSTHIQTSFVERERKENKLFCLFVCVIFFSSWVYNKDKNEIFLCVCVRLFWLFLPLPP